MLNWYANTFRISEDNITKSGLRRTKTLAWLALLIVPLEIFLGDALEQIDGSVGDVLFTLAIATPLISIMALLFSPLVHRFWARDKYLDEWEIEVKRKGMSAGYKVLFGALVIGIALSTLLTDYSASSETDISFFELDGVAFALLVLAFCVQTLTQLSLIRPIDESEEEPVANAASPILARIAVVFAIFMIFFGAPFVQGFVDGFTEGLNDVPAQQKSK